MSINMNYGSSEHYKGTKGEDYFKYQNQNRALGAKINVRKFKDYVKKTDRVMDFGCGGGWILKELDCALKVGVEINKSAHETCERNSIKVYCTTEEVTEGNFDLIISHHCLEHVPYPIRALESLRTLLRPGGKLVMVVPIDDWRSQKVYIPEEINHHLQTWTVNLLGHTIAESGLKVEKINIITHAWFPKWDIFYHIIPEFLFDGICWFWAVARKRRQLIAIAEKP